MGRKRKKESGHSINLEALAERGLLPELVEQYVLHCIKKTASEKSKNRIFPNVSGFCRFCGLGREDLESLQSRFPREYGALLSIFEDEALNSDISASTLAYYMKNFLGSDGGQASENEQAVRFEHDILGDGQ